MTQPHDPTHHAGHHGHGGPGHDPLARAEDAHDHGAHDHGAHDHGGHDAHAGHSVEMFRSKFWISLLLTIPTIVWGEMLAHLVGYAPPHFPGSQWIAPVFGTAVFLYGGPVFLRGAARELADRLPGMMTLISLAITVAFGFSVATTLGFRGMPLWEELATLVTIMILGHWIEMRSISRASGALHALAARMPRTATRVTGDQLEEVDVSELRAGDMVLVRPGASVPADGTVRDGRSSLDESMMTGESRPVGKEEGDTVVAGTINGDGALRVEVTGTGDQTLLAGILRLVEQAQTSRSRAQALADRAAFGLTVVALAAGTLTFAGWMLAGAEAGYAVERTVTVLVIACPHALGLAIPLVVAVSTTLGAQSGLLVRDRRGLEEARRLDVVVFDKTGTLTHGTFGVVDVTADGMSDDHALALAAAVEADSEHPIARGIVRSATERGLEVPRATGLRNLTGRGVQADIEGQTALLGGEALLRDRGVEVAPSLRAASDRAGKRGETAIFLILGDRVCAVLAVADIVREESADAVAALHASGIRVAMLTGDAHAVADAVAADLGIDEVFAEVLPEDKASHVASMQEQGLAVAMVGDGVNDAPALATADLGIAIGAGTDVAVEAGDVVLVRSDPRDVARIVTLSRLTYRKMTQNLWWAAGYNIVAIPLAAGVLAPWGLVLHPAVGALLMSASTVIVAINAQLLRRASLSDGASGRGDASSPAAPSMFGASHRTVGGPE